MHLEAIPDLNPAGPESHSIQYNTVFKPDDMLLFIQSRCVCETEKCSHYFYFYGWDSV